MSKIIRLVSNLNLQSPQNLIIFNIMKSCFLIIIMIVLPISSFIISPPVLIQQEHHLQIKGESKIAKDIPFLPQYIQKDIQMTLDHKIKGDKHQFSLKSKKQDNKFDIPTQNKKQFTKEIKKNKQNQQHIPSIYTQQNQNGIFEIYKKKSQPKIDYRSISRQKQGQQQILKRLGDQQAYNKYNKYFKPANNLYKLSSKNKISNSETLNKRIINEKITNNPNPISQQNPQYLNDNFYANLQKHLAQQNRVFDCFVYNGQDQILGLKLQIMSSFVDYFIISEAPFSDTGTKKELLFNMEKFQKFNQKIIYLPLSDVPEPDQQITDYLRNSAMNTLKSMAKQNDFIISSDIDEILSERSFMDFNSSAFPWAMTELRIHQKFLNRISVYDYGKSKQLPNYWLNGIRITTFKNLKDKFQDIDGLRSQIRCNMDISAEIRQKKTLKCNGHVLKAAGWYFGSISSHQSEEANDNKIIYASQQMGPLGLFKDVYLEDADLPLEIIDDIIKKQEMSIYAPYIVKVNSNKQCGLGQEQKANKHPQGKEERILLNSRKENQFMSKISSRNIKCVNENVDKKDKIIDKAQSKKSEVEVKQVKDQLTNQESETKVHIRINLDILSYRLLFTILFIVISILLYLWWLEKFQHQSLSSTIISNKQNGIVKSYAVNTHQGISRGYNQDRVSITLNIKKNGIKAHFFAIYDGHGGSLCCQFLKDTLHDFLIGNPNFPSDPRKALTESITFSEDKFMQYAKKNKMKDGQPDKSGSCVLITLIVDEVCYVANVGDSRAILSTEGGRFAFNLSRDHRPSDARQQQRILSAGGKIYRTQMVRVGEKASEDKIFGPLRIYPGKLSVSRTLGDIQAKQPDLGGRRNVVSCQPQIRRFRLSGKQDFVVLCCDGVLQRMQSMEVVETAWRGMRVGGSMHVRAGGAVDELIRQSMLRKSSDNLTAIVICFSELGQTSYRSPKKTKISCKEIIS